MSDKHASFTYNYSAKQQEELRRIREKYTHKEEDKMEQLRRLDESATRPGMITSIAAGVIGSLLLGIGMCCTMVWIDMFVFGIVIGVVGIAVISAAYPLYSGITKKCREKLSTEILKLTDELMK